MYEFITNLDKKEYEAFVFNNEKSHFMQSIYWGEVQKEKHFKAYLVGVKKDSTLVATALILEKKLFKDIGYMYSPRGPILDYSEKDLVKYFTKSLKSFAKKHKAMFLRIDPDIKLDSLDTDGNITNGENNHQLVTFLKSIGYTHKGFNKNFENSQPRYTFRLAIDKPMDEVFKGFHPTTRKILNKDNQYKLDIYKGSITDLEEFYVTMKETAIRENIIPSKIDYYKTFYSTLNKENMSDIYMVKVNIMSLKNEYNRITQEVKEEIKKIESFPQKNDDKCGKLIKELNDKIDKMNKELEEINLIKEKDLTLSSIITAKYKDKAWTVHGGNHSKLRFLNANYLLYYEIIKDANKEGYKIVDFFGTTGNPNPDNYVYGIHLFKKRFGGEYTEFIGEFDLITNKILYILYNKYIKIKKRFK